MRRKRNSIWEVMAEEDVWYCGRKHGWKIGIDPLDLEPYIGSSNICTCKTKARALSQARALKSMIKGTVMVTHITYLHGQRMGLDYEFKG